MTSTRPGFSGVAKIVRFNRGKYVAALVAVAALAVAATYASSRFAALIAIATIVFGVAVSLGVSHWVYDRSALYDLRWSNTINRSDRVVVVHAGFDEVSPLLRARLGADPHAVSFYDRIELAEPSIRRAQDQAVAPGSSSATSGQPLLRAGTFDWVVAFMCLHEIRIQATRRQLLIELKDGVAEGGTLVVVEHLRDIPNALAFSAGVSHFLPKSVWSADFVAAGLQVVSEHKTTPFVTEFILRRAPNT